MVLMNREKAGRKGQFFVLSAVAIILVLYGLSDFLKLQSFDATPIQSNTIAQVAKAIEGDINRTMIYSAPGDVADNLDELSAFEKNALESAGYVVAIEYNLSGIGLPFSSASAKIQITTYGVYYEKTIYPG